MSGADLAAGGTRAASGIAALPRALDPALFGGAGNVAGQAALELPCALDNTRVRGHCEIGAFTAFGPGCDIGDCVIGRYCAIGAKVLIGQDEPVPGFLSTHRLGAGHAAPIASHAEVWRAYGASAPAPLPPLRTRIGDGVRLGAGAIVMAGVQIGAGAVIEAGTLVTHDVAPGAIMAGNPAHQLGWRADHRGGAPLQPRAIVLRAGAVVDTDAEMRTLVCAPMAAGRADQARQTLATRMLHRHPAIALPAKRLFGQLAARDASAFSPAGAALALRTIDGADELLRRVDASLRDRIVAPPSVFEPEFSTIFQHLNVTGGGALSQALATLYFPWEVRDTVSQAAQLAWRKELATLRRWIPFVSWHGGGWQFPFPRDRYRLFTMAREPVARFLSFHNTLLTHGDAPWVPPCVQRREGIDALVEHVRGTENAVSFALQVGEVELPHATLKAMAPAELFETVKDIVRRRYFLVGITERFDASLLAASLLLGYERVPFWSNRFSTEAVPGRVQRADLSPSSLTAIEQLFAVDIALYRWLQDEFERDFGFLDDFLASRALRLERSTP